jgi:hypothetical protein
MRSAGELHIRVGKITAGVDRAEGLEVTIAVDDLTASTYIDPDEIQPLLEAPDAALQMPTKPKKQIVREVAYETKGRFRVVARQTGGDEPDFRFMIFIPAGVTGLPKLPAEYRADGPAGVLVPHVLRGIQTMPVTYEKRSIPQGRSWAALSNSVLRQTQSLNAQTALLFRVRLRAGALGPLDA